MGILYIISRLKKKVSQNISCTGGVSGDWYLVVSCAPKGIWWSHCEIQEAGLDEPLAWSSRAFLMYLWLSPSVNMPVSALQASHLRCSPSDKVGLIHRNINDWFNHNLKKENDCQENGHHSLHTLLSKAWSTLYGPSDHHPSSFPTFLPRDSYIPFSWPHSKRR